MVYLWLLVFTLTGPLCYSFEAKVAYSKKWWALFPAITFTATYFLIWDEVFTRLGVWGFNPHYLLGVYVCSLPVEEVAFFFIVPFACVFLYEIMNRYVTRDIFRFGARQFSVVLGVVLLIVAAIYHNRWYTVTTFGLTGGVLLAHGFIWRAKYLGRFYLGYLVSLVPFFLVNGILTGSFLRDPVVWYNNSENLGIRLGTIPLEDTMYMLLMLLSTVTLYEYLLSRFGGAPRNVRPSS